MAKWGFLTNHALVMLELGRRRDATLREVALALGLTERTVIGILRTLEEDGVVSRRKDGRRNRYRVDMQAVMATLGRQPVAAYTLEQVSAQLLEMAREARSAAGRDGPRRERDGGES